MFIFTDLGRVVVIFFLVFFLVGFVHGSPLMYMIALFCLAVICISSFLAWFSLRGLHIKRVLPGSTTFSGDPLDAKIILSEAIPHWRLLELFDQHTNLITGHTIHRRMAVMTEGARSGSTTVAGARQPAKRLPHNERQTEIHDTMRFAQRGHYRLGPLTVFSYDPFGLIYIKRDFRDTEEMVVYPHPLPMPEIVFTGLGGRQTNEVRPVGHVGETADFHSIRPYTHGDDLRRVHWKSTAHTGKLAVKEYEFHSSGAVNLILDLQSGIHCGNNDFSTLEASITLAASMLNYVLGAGNQAGMLSTGEQVISLQPESGQRQMHRALEALALARDNGHTSLAQALASEEGTRSGRCTTIVITPTTDKGIIGPLLTLRGRSAQVLLVLLNPRGFYQAEQDFLKSNRSIWSLAAQPINIKRGLQSLTGHRQRIPAESDHQALKQAVAAAGIEFYPIDASIPIHQALQGIRTRIK